MLGEHDVWFDCNFVPYIHLPTLHLDGCRNAPAGTIRRPGAKVTTRRSPDDGPRLQLYGRERFSIPFVYPDPEIFHRRAQRWVVSPFHREELPARAFYAADAEKRDLLDQALFEAAWVEGFDVNDPEAIRWAAQRAGLLVCGELAAAARMISTEAAAPGRPLPNQRVHDLVAYSVSPAYFAARMHLGVAVA